MIRDSAAGTSIDALTKQHSRTKSTVSSTPFCTGQRRLDFPPEVVRRAGLERDVEAEKRKSRELAEATRVKEREYGKLRAQYDKVSVRCAWQVAAKALTIKG